MADINGTNGDDTLQGTRSADIIHGLDGNDTIYGGNGSGDTMFGDNGDDTISFSAASREVGYGGAGENTFFWGTAAFSKDSGGERDGVGDFEPGLDHLWLGWVGAAGGIVSIDHMHGNLYRVSVVTPGMVDFAVDVEVLGSAPLTMADIII